MLYNEVFRIDWSMCFNVYTYTYTVQANTLCCISCLDFQQPASHRDFLWSLESARLGVLILISIRRHFCRYTWIIPKRLYTLMAGFKGFVAKCGVQCSVNRGPGYLLILVTACISCRIKWSVIESSWRNGRVNGCWRIAPDTKWLE